MVDLSTRDNQIAVAQQFAQSVAPQSQAPQSTPYTSTALGGSGGFGGTAYYTPAGQAAQAPQSLPQAPQQATNIQNFAPIKGIGSGFVLPQNLPSNIVNLSQLSANALSNLGYIPNFDTQGNLISASYYTRGNTDLGNVQPKQDLGYPLSLNPSGMSYAPKSQNTSFLDKIYGFGSQAYQKGTEFLGKVYEASPFNPNRYVEYQRVQGYDELGNPIYVISPTRASLLTATFVGAAPYSISSVPKPIALTLGSEIPQNTAFLGTRRTYTISEGQPKITTNLVYQTEGGQFGKFAATSYPKDNTLISIGAGKNIIPNENKFVGFAVGQSKETPVLLGRDVNAYPVTGFYREFPGAKGINFGQTLSKEGTTTFLSGGIEAQGKGANALFGKVYTKAGEGTYAGLLRTGTSDFATVDNSLIGRSTQQAISIARANLPITGTTTRTIPLSIKPITSLLTTSEIKPSTPVKMEAKLSQSLISDQSLAGITSQASIQAPKTILFTPSVSGTAEIQRQPQQELSIQAPKEIQRDNTLLLSSQTQAEIQRQPQINISQQMQVQNQRQAQFQAQPSILKLESPRIPKTSFSLPALSSGKSKLTLKNVSDAFIALTKRRGKLIELGRFKTPQEAFSKSEQVALGTLARRVEVIRASTGKPVELTSLPNYLRPAKRERGVYIQKNALSARSEVSEILSAKRQSPKGFFSSSKKKGRRLKL